MNCSAGKTVSVIFLSLAFLLTVFCYRSLSADEPVDETAAAIRKRLETMDGRNLTLRSGETLRFPAELRIFYTRRGFRTAWTDHDGILPVAASLRNALLKAALHGLDPEEYHLVSLERLFSQIRKGVGIDGALFAENRMELDLLLTDAFFLYAAHLASGKVNPETVDAQWFLRKRPSPNLLRTLEQALSSAEVESILENLAPSSPAYANLRKALSKYRDIERRRKWPVMMEGIRLKKGDRSEQVALLRERLDVPEVFPFWEDREDGEGKYLFDEYLERAVKAFQKSHGLIADGVAGSETLEAMNVTAAERVRQIKVNLERLRWIPDDPGDRAVIINIPEFRLRVLGKEKEVFNSRIVVGKYAQNTPVFGSRITHFILNPYWHVPRSIAVEEILPLIKQSPEYLNWEDMKVLSGSGAKTRIVPPWTIDWENMTAREFNYHLRQDPGPRNPLGRIKFYFPNPYDVYLHDTPYLHLFEQKKRNFSHGCIRVENPVELAVVLLGGNSIETRKQLLSAIETGKRKQFQLRQPVSIRVFYFTTWAEADGTVHFRKDIYNHDLPLQKALEKTGLP